MADLLSRLAEAIEAEADKPRAERVGLAHVMIAVVQPDIDERDAEILRLRAELAKYVGHEPTIAQEMAYLGRVYDAAHAFADEMADYCSPHGVAADYAQRLRERLAAATAPTS